MTLPKTAESMFNMPTLIQKKRDGADLSAAEIEWIIEGATQGKLPEYQLSAFLMATFFQGMTLEETTNLTQAMVRSGKQFDLRSISGPKVDKHSTGGIGDKVSIILAPLAAACGLKVPMMAGRGLGHTGGTIDKLEAIPGYQVVLDESRMKDILKSVGAVIISQSKEIAPADRILYALRDVTATIECIPLITSSILSKKIAEGAEGLVMDIKVGNGAFMKQKTQAIQLAKTLRNVGKKAGLELRVTLSNMDQPLGYSVGNALEIFECLEVLHGKALGPYDLSSVDLTEITLHLCAQMLEVGKRVKSYTEGRKLAISQLENGNALKVFREMVAAQNGNLQYLDEPWRLLECPYVVDVRSKKRGYITEMQTEGLGKLLVQMGGGRTQVGEKIDHRVGILFHKKLGQQIKQDETLVTLFCRSAEEAQTIESQVRSLIKIGVSKKSAPKLILEANVK